MKSKNTTPLSEEIWKREYGPKDETHREPMIITPQNRQRPIKPTFDNHSSSKSLTKASKHTDYLDNLENIQQSDFTNPEHYFDALEAKQILEQMRSAG
jgi:hypothetical protein